VLERTYEMTIIESIFSAIPSQILYRQSDPGASWYRDKQ